MTLALLVGCGGSGSGGDDGSATASPTPVVTVSASPLPTAVEPTVTPSPFPEILLAAGRTFDERGEHPTPLVLRNAGDGWVDVHADAPALTFLNGIVFSTPEVAWAFGFFGNQQTPVLLRTADAGLTWTDVTARLPREANSIADLAFEDVDTGFMVTRPVVAGSAAFATHDGGVTWQAVGLPSGGLTGAYAVGTRGTAAELVRYESDGLAVIRLDDPVVPLVRLAPPGGSRILGPNAFSTFDVRGWIAASLNEPIGSAGSRAVILTSAAPGADWVEQTVDQTGYGELRAIDMRDAQNGIAGGRGVTPASTGLSPLAVVLDAESATWRIAPITGVASDTTVVDVVRETGDGAWAIVSRTDVSGEAAFLRSDDGGRAWHREATAFEHGVQLTDLTRNTEAR